MAKKTKMVSLTIEQLEADVLEARKAVAETQDRLDATLDREMLPGLRKKLVGKTFKYRNGYSGLDKWWMYAKVLSVDSHRNCTVVTFQVTSDRKIQIDTDRYAFVDRFDGSDYLPITNREYEAAKRAFLKKATQVLAPQKVKQ